MSHYNIVLTIQTTSPAVDVPADTNHVLCNVYAPLAAFCAGRKAIRKDSEVIIKSLKRQPILSTDIAFNDAFIGYMLLLVVTRHN